MPPERRQQIDELYHAAREHGREVLAGADPELKREVEALLAQDESPSGSDFEMLAAGTRLSPYEISPPSAKAAWAKCIRRGTRGCIAR